MSCSTQSGEEIQVVGLQVEVHLDVAIQAVGQMVTFALSIQGESTRQIDIEA